MGNDGSPLTRDEKILWIMNALECHAANDYYAVLERLHPLTYEELDIIDRSASEGIAKAEKLRHVLLNKAHDMKDILFACPLAYKYDRHYNVDTMLELMDAIRKAGCGLHNINAHMEACNHHYHFISSEPMNDESYYKTNTGLINLVEEYPDRVKEIIALKMKRKSNNAGVIREMMNTTKPLADGAL